jgi:hypothetical protein
MVAWNRDEIQIQISRLLDSLISVAMEDHIITDDEEKIIEGVRMKLWQMENEIAELIKLNDSEFKKKLTDTLNSTLMEVYQTARDDGIITEEEKSLINKIRAFMRNNGIETLI